MEETVCSGFPGPERPAFALSHSASRKLLCEFHPSNLGSTSSCSQPAFPPSPVPSSVPHFLSLQTPYFSDTTQASAPKPWSLPKVWGGEYGASDLTLLCLSFPPLYNGHKSSSISRRGGVIVESVTKCVKHLGLCPRVVCIVVLFFIVASVILQALTHSGNSGKANSLISQQCFFDQQRRGTSWDHISNVGCHPRPWPAESESARS